MKLLQTELYSFYVSYLEVMGDAVIAIGKENYYNHFLPASFCRISSL